MVQNVRLQTNKIPLKAKRNVNAQFGSVSIMIWVLNLKTLLANAMQAIL